MWVHSDGNITLVIVEIDCLGFFEEIVRRIEVTFRRAQTQVKAEREVFKSNNLSNSTKEKRRKRRREKGEKKHTTEDIYSKY
jgi:hypothetical protein